MANGEAPSQSSKLIKSRNFGYKKGYRFELRVKKFLETKGYVVVRSGRSLKIDLLALKAGERPIMIECKAVGKPYLRVQQRKEQLLLAQKCGAKLMVAYKDEVGHIVLRSYTSKGHS